MKWGVRGPGKNATGPWRRELSTRFARAAARATDKASIGARDEIRAAMRGQRLGNLANAIGATSDLRKKRAPTGESGTFDVAGFVTTRITSARTAGALQAYLDQDTTDIAPRKGKYLWIATNEIPRRAGRRRMTPELYRSTGLEQRIGPLVFIKGKHAGEAFYVVQDTTVQVARAGKPKRAPKSGRLAPGRARVGIVAFVGIRITRRSRRVAPRDIAAKWQRRLPQLIVTEL